MLESNAGTGMDELGKMRLRSVGETLSAAVQLLFAEVL